MCTGSNPSPVSDTVTLAAPLVSAGSSCAAATVTVTSAPFPEYLIAFSTRLVRTCASWSLSPGTITAPPGKASISVIMAVAALGADGQVYLPGSDVPASASPLQLLVDLEDPGVEG